MWSPSRIFPVRPDIERGQQVRAGEVRRRSETQRLLQLARRADWLAEMWAEFPAVSRYHRQYARMFRTANAVLWNCPDSADRRLALAAQTRRLAWRAYRRAFEPPDTLEPAQLRALAQRQKVDSYWARQLWGYLDVDPVRLSVLRARDYELQRLFDTQPDRPAGPGFFAWCFALLRRLFRFGRS